VTEAPVGGGEVRAARLQDAAAIAAIHAQGIEERTATFRTEPLPPQEVAEWIGRGDRFPVLVYEDREGVAGAAWIVPYAGADFYAGVGEYAVYVARRARGRGVGRELLEAACAQARRLGYWKLVGKLFTTNQPSIELAHACGFRDVGVHHRHGRLDGAWRDVLVVERLLGEAAGE
jgi:L-amino acid N-acyltransferase YncA